MKNIVFILFILSIICFGDNLIIIVPDGLSFDAYSILRKVSSNPQKDIVFDRIENMFIYENTTIDAYITDSGASGTAMFTGKKTKDGIIGQDSSAIKRKRDGKSIENIIEYAQNKNMLTGIITNTRITHATPASAFAHINSRSFELDIALQLSDKNIDLLMGGGSTNFIPNTMIDPISNIKGRRKDNKNLLEKMINNNYQLIKNSNQLKNIDYSKRVLGLFSNSHMPYQWDNEGNIPSLSMMSIYGLKYLHKKAISQNKDFVLIIESGRIDHAAHKLDINRYMWELFEYEKVAEYIMNYCDTTNTTLVIIPDHATANPVFTGIIDNDSLIVYDAPFIKNDFIYPDKKAFLSLINRISITWTNPKDNNRFDKSYRGQHTGSDCIGFAYGENAELFYGFMKNNEIYYLLKKAIE